MQRASLLASMRPRSRVASAVRPQAGSSLRYRIGTPMRLMVLCYAPKALQLVSQHKRGLGTTLNPRQIKPTRSSCPTGLNKIARPVYVNAIVIALKLPRGVAGQLPPASVVRSRSPLTNGITAVARASTSSSPFIAIAGCSNPAYACSFIRCTRS